MYDLYGEVWEGMLRYTARNKEQRRGQAYFNYVRSYHPEVIEEPYRLEWDCFDDDGKIPAFIHYLAERCRVLGDQDATG